MKYLPALSTVFSVCLLAISYQPAAAQLTSTGPQQTLAQAASEERYTYLVFYRDDSPTTRAMAQTVKEALLKRPDAARSAYVQISNPSNKALADRYGVSRAPMPLTVAVAPNGAMTGIYPNKVTDQQLASALVTRSKASCMKAIQQNKLVFLCIQSSSIDETPQAVKDFQLDPQFKDRSAVVYLPAADAGEAPFLSELKIDPQQTGHPTTVFMAPPGVLIGRFSAAATRNEMAAALHKAGKCCDDPNCKHAHGVPVKK